MTRKEFFYYLNLLFTRRRLSELAAAIDHTSFDYPDEKLFFRLRLAHHRGRAEPTPPDLGQLIHSSNAAIAGAPAINLVVEQLVRRGEVAALRAFIEGHEADVVKHAKPSRLMGCFRLLANAGEYEVAQRLFSVLKGHASPEKMLYFLEVNRLLPAGTAEGALPGAVNWRAVASEWASGVKKKDGGDILVKAFAEPISKLDRLKHDYLDIRFETELGNKLYSLILARVTRAEPLSLVRLGDGEAYAFQSRPHWVVPQEKFESDNVRRERHWWGVELPPDVRATLARKVHQAIRNADILGIPSIYRIIRDQPRADFFSGSNTSVRGLAVVLDAFESLGLDEKYVTEERCHQILFEPARLHELMNAAKRTVILSCWSKSELSRAVPGEFECIQIPPAAKVAEFGLDTKDVLPFCYERYAEQIRVASGPGVLVLVGGGLIGKIFITEARAAGAVALDIGAMADYLVGVKTRSIADII